MNCLNLIYEHLQAVFTHFLFVFLPVICICSWSKKWSKDSTVILQLFSGDTVIYKLSQIKTDYITGFKKKNNKNIWTFKIYPNNDVAYYTLKNHEKVWIYQPDPSQGNFLKLIKWINLFLAKKTLNIIISHYDIL